MGKKATWRFGSRFILIFLLGAVMTLGAAAPAASNGAQSIERGVHPVLLRLMNSRPDFRVPILVQKANPSAKSEALAQAAGATLEEDFAFIHTFKITVPARAISGLAQNPAVRYISPDGPVTLDAVDASTLVPTYPLVTGAAQLWNAGTGLTGKGVTVAVLDSGVNPHPDFGSRVLVRWATRSANTSDVNGHGTHVAGTIAGRSADGRYIGVAPEANIVAIKTADDKYQTSEASVVKALQWVYQNRSTYNIRVINMSISAQTPNSYLFSPMAAAAEKLWQSGVVVVVSAGNRGPGENVMWYSPANDPFVITVGALDDAWTLDGSDDSLAPFSSYGITQNNHVKPDVVAPGRKIVAPLASTSAVLAKQLPDRVTPDGKYIRLSGTSMAAPVVSGLIALMLERYPELTPNQVKWALTATTVPYTGQPVGTAGLVNLQGALNLIASHKAIRMPLGAANEGLLLSPQIGLLTNNTNWESTDWSQATYEGVYWETAYWDTAYWDTAYWDTAYWDTAYWDTYYEENTLLEWD